MQKNRPSAQENVAKKKAQNAILFPVLAAMWSDLLCRLVRRFSFEDLITKAKD